jgi:hypothetical protein
MFDYLMSKESYLLHLNDIPRLCKERSKLSTHEEILGVQKHALFLVCP